MVATLIGGLSLATSVALAGTPASDSPGVPSSSVTTYGAKTAHYCVTDYAPNAAVAVHNDMTGAKASIQTNHRGSGCTDVPVEVDCGQRVKQTIVATGVGADGNPGTSTVAANVPGNIGDCAGKLAGDDKSATTGLTGSDIALIAIGGVALAGLIGGGVVSRRRRRSASVE